MFIKFEDLVSRISRIIRYPSDDSDVVDMILLEAFESECRSREPMEIKKQGRFHVLNNNRDHYSCCICHMHSNPKFKLGYRFPEFPLPIYQYQEEVFFCTELCYQNWFCRYPELRKSWNPVLYWDLMKKHYRSIKNE